MTLDYKLSVEVKDNGLMQDCGVADLAAIVHSAIETALEHHLSVRLPWVLSVEVVPQSL